MLLRRVVEHVRNQNWFAVAIDFLIVVIGVFVGLQVQEWSDERRVAASESQYLVELREEIADNAKLTRGTFEAMNEVVASGKRAIRYLESDQQCVDDCWRVLVDLFAASQVFRPAISTAVFDEMLRLGFPRSARIASAVDEYYATYTFTHLGIDPDPQYRLTFRQLITVEAHEQLWANCHSIEGTVEQLIVDCPPAMTAGRVRSILDVLRKRPELLEQLQYWIGMHALWLPVFSELMVNAENALRIIDSERM